MATAIITRTYEDYDISYNSDGWFNATQAAAKFDKEPSAWLRQSDTAKYIAAICKRKGDSGFVTEFNEIKELDSTKSSTRNKILSLVKATGMVKTKAGASENGGGTWLHPKLAVAFARWLDVDFAVWCDEQIDDIVRSGKEWDAERDNTRQSNLAENAIIQATRADLGKETTAVHYMSEAKLITFVAFGSFIKRDRDSMTKHELALVSYLEIRNGVMYARNLPYEDRKARLLEMAEAWRAKNALKLGNSK